MHWGLIPHWAADPSMMPVILHPEQYAGWLDHGTPIPDALAMLVPFPGALMEAVRLGPAVNNVRNEGPQCLEPAA